MGGKERPPKKARGHNPLGDDINADRYAAQKESWKQPRLRPETADDEQAFLLPNQTTHKILKAARKQLKAEEDEEYNAAVDDEGLDAPPLDEQGEGEEEDEEPVELEYDDQESEITEVQDFGDLGAEYMIDDEEHRLLDKFQPATALQTRNLADIIMAKIQEKEAAQHGQADTAADEGEDETQAIDKRVARVYSAIGSILKTYRSGKIPKAFKVLPHVQNWEKLLMLTRPHEWSPHATYAATRIFAAHLNEKMAQRFYSSVLLPIVHFYFSENKRLHPSLYMSVRKALFKPVAFYKGFLLPMCKEGECSLKEALIVGSVLQKMHLPPVPTAVVIVKIAELPYCAANNVFLRVLIDKKMALPFQAIDALIIYFHRFCLSHTSQEKLPVLWHQTLLSFVIRYKEDLTDPQLDLLKQVCSKHFHHLITPEVRREIAATEKKRLQQQGFQASVRLH